jgi:hypothetical protein
MLLTKCKVATAAVLCAGLLVALIGGSLSALVAQEGKKGPLVETQVAEEHGVTPAQEQGKDNPRQQPAAAPVQGQAEKAALDDIIAKVRKNEARYDNLEVVLEQASDIGKRKPVEGQFETADGFRGEFREFATHAISLRCISQDGKVYFHETDKPVDSKGKAFSFKRTRVFDGETTRVLTQHDEGDKPTSRAQLIAGRSDDEHFVRPHMLLLHFMQFRVPLSTYLSGHKAMMEHPTGNWQSELTMENSYHGVETIKGLNCHKVWITTCIGDGDQRVGHDRWELWLAEDRNYIPVRMRGYTFRWSKDVPMSDGVAEDLREIKPGIWFPFSVRVTAYNQYALKSLETRELQWRERYTVQKVSLSPKYDRSFFGGPVIPEGTEVEEIKDGKLVRRFRQEKPSQK